MKRKLTITVSEEIYEGLHKVVGPRKISQFLQELAKPHLLSATLLAGYKEASEDHEQEAEALEWSEALLGDALDAG